MLVFVDLAYVVGCSLFFHSEQILLELSLN